ncbi:ParB/RepB/Spo0J family partition protein [Candidatus Bathyarchaeota archaeon]|nr:ParB/RepB/Spo0J family partition protein [Candidatus Bathyarchaeota archaeon]
MVVREKVEPLLSTKIRIEELELEGFTPRLSVDHRYVDELAESLKTEGQLKPIIVRPHPEKPNCYQVLDGVHRVRAARKLGWTLIRAEVRKLSDEEALILAMRVNQLHGKRLDPLEEALRIQKLIEQYRYTQAEIAQKFMRSQQWVSDRLKLVKDAAPELQTAVTTRVVKPTIAREIAKLPKDIQPKVVEKVAKEKLSRRKVKVVVEAIKENPESADNVLAKPIEAFAGITQTEEQLKKVLEMSPEKPVMERVECPCGCGYKLLIDWINMTYSWLQPEGGICRGSEK